MGQPTYPINIHTIRYYLAYWKKMEELVKEAITNLDKIKEGAAIDYGHPQGDEEARTVMATAMSSWYDIEIKPEHILYTGGGAGALNVLFETLSDLHKDTSGYRVITPFPHYSLYANPNHLLHPIDVMKEKGYKLTAEALEKSILEAYKLSKVDGKPPAAVLLCNPNNPLGTVIDETELKKIADVLRRYPELHIIFDEAYAEMSHVKVPSFLSIAPDLKPRTCIMRSATKALSAAGERMAILLAFDDVLMSKLLAKNISTIGHAPRAAQMAYAEAMKNLVGEEHERLKQFYKKKVDYVNSRLKEMGACMPDPDYQVEGTFYVLADFNDMLGLEIPKEARRALGKTGKVSTDEELAYYLLFQDSVMIAPLSYFGTKKASGFMRITCSRDLDELMELMDRLETRLLEARKIKNKALHAKIEALIAEFTIISPDKSKETLKKIDALCEEDQSCISLKEKNAQLNSLYNQMITLLKRNKPMAQEQAANKLQAFFKKRQNKTEQVRINKEQEKEWSSFLDTLFSEPCAMKTTLLKMPESERSKFTLWKQYNEVKVEQLKKAKLQ